MKPLKDALYLQFVGIVAHSFVAILEFLIRYSLCIGHLLTWSHS